MEINSENLNSISPGAGQKKLKQTRLPFTIISPGASDKSGKSASSDTKKRKLSNEDIEEPLPVPKINKIVATKENEVLDLIDDSNDEESTEKIKIKLPGPMKKSNKKLKLDNSTLENHDSKKHSKGGKIRSHKKGIEINKSIVSVKVEEKEIINLDSDDDDEPQPLDVFLSVEDTEKEKPCDISLVEDTEKEKTCEVSLGTNENIERVLTGNIDTLKTDEVLESSNAEKINDEKLNESVDLITDGSFSESFSKINTPNSKVKNTPESGLKRSHKKISEEEKLQRQREREEARRIEREAKEAQKRQEREAKEQQRLREKQEREAKLQKERDEKEAQKRAEKEERERKKQAELEQKAEEKKQKELKKEEERLKKEEEKQKKELEKQQREEEERRKKEEADQKWKKSAQLMKKFFVPKKNDTKQMDEESSNDSEKISIVQNFMPFEVKENMRLAPVIRTRLNEIAREKLENILKSYNGDTSSTYLNELKTNYIPGKCSSVSWQEEDDSQDIILIDTKGQEHQLEQIKKPKQKYKAKFLSFHENRRPAFYGTWRKQSAIVKGRKPFATDMKYFDYEVDSDEEWEEEEPGESLHGSDDEKDKDNVDDDYEVDNDFFVPHGHLSDEELEPDDDIAPEDNSPEAQKARLKVMQQEFAEEHKKKTEKLKPRIIGCIWVRSAHGGQDQCSPIVWEMLSARAMIFSSPITQVLDDPEDEKVEPTNNLSTKKIKITEDGVKELIRLIHGNPNSKKFLSSEFAAYRKQKYGEEEGYQEFMLITTKIKEIAEYKQCTEEGPMHKIKAWFVKPEILEKYGLSNLPTINTWEYVLNPKIVASELITKKQISTPISAKKVAITEDAMPDLIRLVHGNMRNRQFLVEEFRTFRKNTYGDLPGFQEFHHIGSTILKIAEYKKSEENGPLKGKSAYFVHDHILKQYNMEDLPLPNTWSYHAVEKKKVALTSEKLNKSITKSDLKESKETTIQQPSAGPLTKFAVKITDDERQAKNHVNSPSTSMSIKKSPAIQKKRVQLIMSVPRGESISESKKSLLISQFLQQNKSTDKTESTQKTADQDKNDDVILID
uniref:CSON014838 protein n=1 Tax=Culicoides sonorensis TaxID=179676 RepID=A0A336L2K3_CULSO